MVSKWLDLNNKVIIVTGGSAGIGENIVANLLANNAEVVIADRNPPQVTHPKITFIQCNVAIRTDVQNMVQSVISKFKRIDGLVNNAGVNRARLLVDYYHNDKNHELSDDDFDHMINVNQKAVFICSQEVARQMIKQKSGVIVNIASEAGIEGSKGQSCYSATKAAVHAFTLSWAKELGQFNIRVVGVAPGINEPTPMGNPVHQKDLAYTRGMEVSGVKGNYQQSIPLGRPGRLEEIADLVSYLVSDHSSYITGTTVNITGGKSRG